MKPEETNTDTPPNVVKRRREVRRVFTRSIPMLSSLGWTIVVPVLLGMLAGHWLDRRMDSGITWTMALLTFGVIMTLSRMAATRLQ